jgi:hypothetical protein
VLHALYWRCPGPRSVLVHTADAEKLRDDARRSAYPAAKAFLQILRDVSLVAFVEVQGGLGSLARPALEGWACRFTFDAVNGKLLEAKRTLWKGF